MNFNTEFNKENLKELYSENKLLVLPVVAIIISVFLLLFVILPQMLAFPSNKAQADEETVKLDKMQASYDLLSKTDEKTVDSNLTMAQLALPDKKDFESVLNAISIAAGNSSTQILNYIYQESNGNQTKYPTIQFKIDIAGELKEATSFINELYKTYPLSNVISFTSSDGVTTFQVVFYYRAFPPITPDNRQMVVKMNQSEENALKTISEWSNSSQSSDNAAATPSASASTPF